MIFKHRIQLIAGDYSGDGHEKTNDFFILSNFTRNEIQDAYQAGTIKVGFDLTKSVATDYRDSSISEEKMKMLEKAGFKLLSYDGTEYEPEVTDNGFFLDSQTFAEMYLFVAKLGNPEFSYEFANLDSINIGGYGLSY